MHVANDALSGERVAVHLAKGTLLGRLLNRQRALKDNLRVGRHQDVVGIALDHLHGLAAHGADVSRIADALRQRHGGSHGRSGRNTKGQRPRNLLLALLGPLVVDESDVLRVGGQTDELVLVVHHGSRDGPVGPAAVEVLQDVHAKSLDIFAAVGLVDLRQRQRPQVNIVALDGVLLARARGDDLGLNGRDVRRRQHLVLDFVQAGRGGQGYVPCQTAVLVAGRRADAAGCAEDAPEAIFGADDVVEEGRLVFGLVDEAGDGGGLQVRIDGGFDVCEIAVFAEGVDEGAEAQVSGLRVIGVIFRRHDELDLEGIFAL